MRAAGEAGDPRRGDRGAWRLIVSGPGPGPWNLALDDAIFRAVRRGESPPTLRLYRWSAPTLTIGYAQDRDRDVDRAACRESGIDVIRRVTGGRAVVHAEELTYSVCAPAGLAGFGSGLEEAYGRVAAGLVAGLRLLGLDASPAAPSRCAARAPRSPACFAAVSRHEVAIAGRKLVGSAQRRARGGFLQHGSILLESHDDLLARLLRGPEEGIAGEARMVGLADLLSPLPTAEALGAAIAEGCADAWGARLVRGEPSEAERREAKALETGRYRSEDWNAGRRAGAPAA